MKYIGVYVLCLIFILTLTALKVSTASAIGFGAISSSPYGGRTLYTGPIANFMCDFGTGPVVQYPAGSSPSSFYYYPLGKKSPPQAGDWALGNYDKVPDFTSCYLNFAYYRVYQGVYRVNLFGKSN